MLCIFIYVCVCLTTVTKLCKRANKVSSVKQTLLKINHLLLNVQSSNILKPLRESNCSSISVHYWTIRAIEIAGMNSGRNGSNSVHRTMESDSNENHFFNWPVPMFAQASTCAVTRYKSERIEISLLECNNLHFE